ncbi:hypothetical protein [Thalassospira povalilytica]|uniref:Uncharacterized protein n=1 Tax=Thalassospira povalilytica TaxID=732237 RepID=A0A8I1M992_9PROT|nr:hypothetical protein [Thalassospira povalilytica]MBN8197612.1 hypothetical protein [Thalassospira povalilytica]
MVRMTRKCRWIGLVRMHRPGRMRFWHCGGGQLHGAEFRPVATLPRIRCPHGLMISASMNITRTRMIFRFCSKVKNIIALTGEDWRGAFARVVDCHFSTALHAALSAARKTGKPQIHHLQIFQKDWRKGVRLLLPVVLERKGQEDVLQVFLAIFPFPDHTQ